MARRSAAFPAGQTKAKNTAKSPGRGGPKKTGRGSVTFPATPVLSGGLPQARWKAPRAHFLLVGLQRRAGRLCGGDEIQKGIGKA